MVGYRRVLMFVIIGTLIACVIWGYMSYYEYTYNKSKYRFIEKLVPEKYRLRNTADDEWLIFDPCGLTESDFEYCYSKACHYDSLQQADSSRYYYEKLLSHHNSPNEKEYEKIFSCENDYKEYRYAKWVKYSMASEKTGDKKIRLLLDIELKSFQ